MTGFRYVEVWCETLKQEWEHLKKRHEAYSEEELADKVVLELKKGSNIWKGGAAPGAERYSDAIFRFAYLLGHVVINADLAFEGFQLPKIQEFLKGTVLRGKRLRVLCAGGGPGTEVLAYFKLINKWINEGENFENYEPPHMDVADAVQEWKPVVEHFREFAREILRAQIGKRQFGGWVDFDFTPLDLLDESAKLASLFREKDFVVMNYFLSEQINKQPEAFREFAKSLRNILRPGGYVLIVDRLEKRERPTEKLVSILKQNFEKIDHFPREGKQLSLDEYYEECEFFKMIFLPALTRQNWHLRTVADLEIWILRAPS